MKFGDLIQLEGLDQDLDKLLAGWRKTLLDNLEDPVTKESLVLLSPNDQKLIEAFLKAKSALLTGGAQAKGVSLSKRFPYFSLRLMLGRSNRHVPILWKNRRAYRTTFCIAR